MANTDESDEEIQMDVEQGVMGGDHNSNRDEIRQRMLQGAWINLF